MSAQKASSLQASVIPAIYDSIEPPAVSLADDGLLGIDRELHNAEKVPVGVL